MVLTTNKGTISGGNWSYTPVLEDAGMKLTITLTADDGKGGTVTDTFDISFVEKDNPTFLVSAMDSFNSTTTRFGIPASPTIIRYSTNSKAVFNKSIEAGTELPYFGNIKQNLYITVNSAATVTNVYRAPGGMLIINTNNTEAQVGDTIQIDSNQLTDANGGVLSGTLIMTYDGLGWIPSIQN
ncbi:MAG: hypothetical protein ABS938_11295 [Psychrobacillus psychrodurans]